MSYRDPTYVIFDGDNDKWAYAFMKGWVTNEKVPFDFKDAHDLTSMTYRAQDENYVKAQLYKRLQASTAAIVLIGEKTKDLYRFVRWEIEKAQQLDLPIVAVNLKGKRGLDNTRCPSILKEWCAVHVPFQMKIIRFALDNWPAAYRSLGSTERVAGWRYYQDPIYTSLGL